MKAIIVSRHKSTQDLLSLILRRNGFQFDVLDHVSDPEVLDQYTIVLGNIPLSMFLRSKIGFYVAISLTIPKELRGKELGYKELLKYAEFVGFKKNIVFSDWAPREMAKAVVDAEILLIDNIDAFLKQVKWLINMGSV